MRRRKNQLGVMLVVDAGSSEMSVAVRRYASEVLHCDGSDEMPTK